jgi:hypothetical protein
MNRSSSEDVELVASKRVCDSLIVVVMVVVVVVVIVIVIEIEIEIVELL